MPFQTLMGFQASGVGAQSVGPTGLKQFVSGTVVSAADLNNVSGEQQSPPFYTQLAGVLTGAVITAAGLLVTIPAGLIYFARAIWIASGTTTITVADATTTYIWGCVDGILRTTATATPPIGFDNRSACILCRAIAVGGVATIDSIVQQKSRYADPAARAIYEGYDVIGRGFSALLDTIGGGLQIAIPAGYQEQIFAPLTINQGSITVSGRLRITA